MRLLGMRIPPWEYALFASIRKRSYKLIVRANVYRDCSGNWCCRALIEDDAPTSVAFGQITGRVDAADVGARMQDPLDASQHYSY